MARTLKSMSADEVQARILEITRERLELLDEQHELAELYDQKVAEDRERTALQAGDATADAPTQNVRGAS